MNKIGLLTSGGDAPGMNAAIYGVVTAAQEVGCKVIGFLEGFEGLIDNQCQELSPKLVKPHIGKGGTFLGSSRSERFKSLEVQKDVVEQLKNQEIEALIIIGGDGSFKGGESLQSFGIPSIGIPATIDNDIEGTELTLGFKTAVRNVIDTVDIVMQSAESHQHIYAFEVMGRGEGYIAEMTGHALAADGIITNSKPFNLNKVKEAIEASKQRGHRSQLFIIAESAMSCYEFQRRVEEQTIYKIHPLLLGHIQRGGNPVAEDRILGMDFGREAFRRLANNSTAQWQFIKVLNHHIS